jgi:hypothetical protein
LRTIGPVEMLRPVMLSASANQDAVLGAPSAAYTAGVVAARLTATRVSRAAALAFMTVGGCRGLHHSGMMSHFHSWPQRLLRHARAAAGCALLLSCCSRAGRRRRYAAACGIRPCTLLFHGGNADLACGLHVPHCSRRACAARLHAARCPLVGCVRGARGCALPRARGRIAAAAAIAAARHGAIHTRRPCYGRTCDIVCGFVLARAAGSCIELSLLAARWRHSCGSLRTRRRALMASGRGREAA